MTDTPNGILKRADDGRLKRLIKIQLSNDRIRQVDAILRNVTEKGAGIRLSTELVPGEKVLIEMKNVDPFFGTVAWWTNNRAGLEFNEIVDPTLLIVRTIGKADAEGIFRSPNGFHVFDRFKPSDHPNRPAIKPRRRD